MLYEVITNGRGGATIYIPITTAQRMFKNTEISNIYVQATSSETVEQATDALEVYSKRIVKDEDYFYVYSNREFLDILDDIIGTMSAVLGGIASISRITSYNVCYTKLLRFRCVFLP